MCIRDRFRTRQYGSVEMRMETTDSSRFARPIYPGIRTCIEPAAMDLLATASEGLPRTINLLARAAWIEAAKAKAMSITPEHIQPALRLVPTARDMIAGQK